MPGCIIVHPLRHAFSPVRFTRGPKHAEAVAREAESLNEHVLRWEGRAAEAGANGVRRRRLEGAGATLVRIELPAGTRAAEHAHSHEQFVEVLSGGGTLTTAAGERAFGPGDVFHFPPDTPHAATFERDTVLLEVNVGA